VPPATKRLLYQTRVKVLAQEVGATAIGREDDQFYIRMDVSLLRPRDLQERLPGVARLGRGQLWLDASRTEDWQGLLLWALRAVTAIMRERGGTRSPARRRASRPVESDLMAEAEV
jgi:hypothetical protein